MTIQEAGNHLLFQLYHVYDNSEAANIADLVMENITGWKRIDRVVNKQVKLSVLQEQLLEKYTGELSSSKPVQYVLHEAWFCNMKFFVNENVLIPRPETEELVEWVVSAAERSGLNILDIGTGSGCIPVAIKKKLPGAKLFGCDISSEALAVAAKNATLHKTDIEFIHADILSKDEWRNFPMMDVIVSNPPYIPIKEKEQMHKNVLDHEPHIALFVNDDDPLIFYKTIAEFSKRKLNPGGNIFLEIHEAHASAVAELFEDAEFQMPEIRKDMQGRDRMIRILK